MSNRNQINLGHIITARHKIRNITRKTPLEYSKYYSSKINADVWLKLENLQITGSFKLRGAINSLLSLSRKERSQSVICASAGNHAQGIGYSSQKLGISATVVVPKNTPQTKIESIRSYGVKLIIHGEIYDDAELYAHKLEKKEKMTYISAYNNPRIIAGQGTIGLEILEENSEIEILLIPVGGGGLFSGISIAAKTINPEIKCYGVQSEASPVMSESLKQGKIVKIGDINLKHSIAEGLHGGIEKGSITFPYLQEFCEDILLVNEKEIKHAIIEFLTHHHQICEGASAVGLAALYRYKKLFKNHKIGVVITGANLDFAELKKLIFENKGD
ncbi:MAG: threonine ammonia-lyase [Promethearchaeota archaeon]